MTSTLKPLLLAPPDPSDAAEVAATGDNKSRDRDLRFVDRVYRLRTLGGTLGFFCVASVFWNHGEPAWRWTLLAAHALLWPHVARSLSRRHARPARAELRHLAIDSTLGGIWIALMHFNLLPSALLVTMLTVDKIAVGGLRLAARTSTCLAVAALLTSAAIGFTVEIETPMSVVVACLPFLVAYPLAISTVMHDLSRRIAQQNRWLTELSTTDELTGLANRRQGLAAAAQALARHRRTGGSAVLVAVDIDRFKQVNDRWGHPAGDEILRRVAATLRRCCRVTDTPARFAGDEFLLVLPDTNLEGAAEMTRRFRESLAAEVFERAPGLRCTLSFGAAEAHGEMADVEDWIQQADAALYNAKTTGRDRLVSSPLIAALPPRDAAAPEGEAVRSTWGARLRRRFAAA